MMGGWRALKPFLRPYRARLAGLSVLLVASTLSEGVGIGLLLPLIGWIQKGEEFFRQSPWLTDALARLGLPVTAGSLIALVFSAIAATLTLKFAAFVASARVYNPLMKDLRDAAFGRAVGSHIFYFHSTTSGELTQVLENEVEYAGQAFNFVVVAAASAASLAFMGLLMLALSWKLTLAVTGLGAARYAVSSLFIRRIRLLGAEHGALKGLLKSAIISIHQGIEVVKAFGTEDYERRRFESLSEKVRRNADDMALSTSGNTFAEGLIGDALLCGIVWLAISRFQVEGAALITFLVVVTRVIPKVTAFNDARIRIAEYLSRVTVLPRLLADASSSLSWGSRRKDRFERALTLDGVGMRYPGAGGAALEGVTLEVARGSTVALVGTSGAGKTTLARLILRLFDPTEGRIAIDGVPLPELAREDWTRLVTVVAQDTFIFDDTLEANVKYGAPGCTDEQYLRALERARAKDFVAAMPEGDKTRLGERGVRLSGGQRQRIAIARAFLRDAPILILDEATSAMDSETERLVQEAISDLSKDRTLIVIAHRFSTIRGADRIVVLEHGRVIETGTHEQLFAGQGAYRRFHDLQTLRGQERLPDAV
jgi:subfamily B ATP-binding cassette protein MsbA